MFSFPKIKIGLVGGQGYGKTIFLASLLKLACRGDGKCITLLGEQSEKAKKQIDAILQQIWHGQIVPTTKGELFKYSYLMGKKGEAQWRIVFRDYPGETIDRLVEETSNRRESTLIENGNATFLTRGTTRRRHPVVRYFRKFIKEIWHKIYKPIDPLERNRFKLQKWLNSCDVLIFLLPVNVVENELVCQDGGQGLDKEYLIERVRRYTDFIRELSPALHGQVCLALNKSDLLKRDVTTPDDVIQGVKYIGDFYCALKNRFGESVKSFLISAYGRHRNENSKLAEQEASPVGVAEMLFDVVPLPEKIRVEKLQSFVGGLSSLVGRCCATPIVVGQSVWNYLRGIADEKLRNDNKMVLKRFSLLAMCQIAVVFLLCVLWNVAGNGLNERNRLNELNRLIAMGFDSAQSITEIEQKVTLKTPSFSLGNWNTLLFNGWRERTKDNFNSNLLALVTTAFDDKKDEIEDWVKFSPLTRTNAIVSVREVASNAFARMTVDARQRAGISKILGELLTAEKDVKENQLIDEAYHVWKASEVDYKVDRAGELLREYKPSDYPARRRLFDEVSNYKFDSNYEVLAECRSAPNSQELVSQFLADHPESAFPCRTNELASLRKKLEINEETLVRICLEKIGALDLCDQPNDLTWENRLERAQERVVCVTNCMCCLSKSSAYLSELAETNRVNLTLIREIERCRQYFQAFDGVDKAEPEYKIALLEKFSKDYGNNQYPGVPDRYKAKVLEGQLEELRNYWKTNLVIVLEKNQDDVSLPWTQRKERAKQRKDMYCRYAFAMNANCDQKTNACEVLIREANRQIAFEEAVEATLKKKATEHETFSNIHGFYRNYSADKWGNQRSNEYCRVRAFEMDLLHNLATNLTTELKKYPTGTTNVETEIDNIQNRIRLRKEYCNRLLSTMKEHADEGKQIKTEETALALYRSVEKYLNQIKDLLKEGGDVKGDDENVMATFLSGVGKIPNPDEVPELKDRFVKGEYDKLVVLRDRFDRALEKRMSKALEPIDSELDKEDVDPNEREGLLSRKMLVMSEYLSKFSLNGKIYEKTSRLYDLTGKQKKDQANKNFIDAEYANLGTVLRDDTVSPESKIEAIDGFFGQVVSKGGEKEFPSLRDEFGGLKTRRADLDWNQKFKVLQDSVRTNFLTVSPDKNDTQKVETHIKRGEEFKRQLGKFLGDLRTKPPAGTLAADINEKIKAYKSTLRAKQFYDSAVNANRVFRRQLTAKSYEEFAKKYNEYSNFVEENKLVADQVLVRLKTTNDAVWKDVVALKEAYRKFIINPSVYLAEELIKEKKCCREGEGHHHPIWQFAQKLEKIDSSLTPVSVRLCGYDFSGTEFQSKYLRVDLYVDFRIGNSTAPVWEVKGDGIVGESKNCMRINPDYPPGRMTKHEVSREILVKGLPQTFSLQFANKRGRNHWSGRDKVGLVGVLAKAAQNKGTYEHEFHSVKRGSYSAHVDILFSGLPYVEIEDGDL